MVKKASKAVKKVSRSKTATPRPMTKKRSAKTARARSTTKKHSAKPSAPRAAHGGSGASFEILDFAEANRRLGKKLSVAFEGGYENVLFFAGDLALEGDLLAALGKVTKDTFDLIAVKGDLSTSGRIALLDARPSLWVGGKTRAETLEGGDCEIVVGAGEIRHFVYGDYNDGSLRTGLMETPWVIDDDHDLHVPERKGTRRINNRREGGDADFDPSNIADSFVKGVLGANGLLDVKRFLAHLRAGKPVLRAGATSLRDRGRVEAAKAAIGRSAEVDLTGKRLKAFPPELLATTSLTRLVLDETGLRELPPEIAKLGELEHLSLADLPLAALPDIGALKKLRVLRVSDCSVDGVPVSLPESLGELSALEELDVSGLSFESKKKGDFERLPERTPFRLPKSAAALVSLRRIVAHRTNLIVPTGMHGLASVEEVEMRSGSHIYLRRFPDYVTTFPNLRKLDLSGGMFEEIPASLTRLTKLEELDLREALAMLERPIPDLSALRALRVLRLNGACSNGNVAEPPHARLAPLFSMDLPSLEELQLDRWGAASGHERGPMPPSLLAGIGRFGRLKRLDLSFNGLTQLPDDLFGLSQLEELDLRYNDLDPSARERLARALPNARVNYGS